MKIPNPFFQFENVRWTASGGMVGMVGPHCYELDIPDDSVTCLIQAVDRGRSDAKTVYTERMWTRDFGLMGVGDWETKCKIEAEKEALKVEREKEVKRKAKEARERKATPAPKAEPKVEPKVEAKPLELGGKLEL